MEFSFKALNDLHTLIFDVDRLPVAAAALVLCLVIGLVTGPLSGRAVPLLWVIVSGTIGRIGSRLDKFQRAKSDLLFRGFVIAALAVTVFATLGGFFEAQAVFVTDYRILDIVFLSLCMTAGAPLYITLRLYTALERKKAPAGTYLAIARSTYRDLSSADDYAATRLALCFLVRSLEKGAVAPVLWYVIGGLPFVFAYACLAALNWQFGKNGFSKGFGLVPQALEKLMGFVPNLLTGLYLALGSVFTPAAGIMRSIGAFLTRANKAPYEQGGVPLSVLAWALNLSLGGPERDLSGSRIKNAWVGPDKASAKVDHHHLKHGLYITIMAYLLLLVSLLGAYLWGYGFFL